MQELIQAARANKHDVGMRALMQWLEMKFADCQDSLVENHYSGTEFAAMQAEAKTYKRLLADLNKTMKV